MRRRGTSLAVRVSLRRNPGLSTRSAQRDVCVRPPHLGGHGAELLEDGANVITVSQADALAWTGTVDDITTKNDTEFVATGQIAPAEDDTALEDYSLSGVCSG